MPVNEQNTVSRSFMSPAIRIGMSGSCSRSSCIPAISMARAVLRAPCWLPALAVDAGLWTPMTRITAPVSRFSSVTTGMCRVVL